MVSTARNILACLGNLSLAALLILGAPQVFAQTDTTEPTASLQQIRATLQQLDALASACVTEPGDPEACEAFRQAVDGELLIAYLDNCEVAKRWRDDFVSSQVESSRSDAGDASGVLLGHLVDIEYLCGEKALTRATESVVAAYSHVRSTGPSLSLQTQWSNWQQQRLRESESRRQIERLSSQLRHLQRHTDRQFEQLELELLRQQTSPPVPR